MKKKNHIVLTTINVPLLLRDYQHNIGRHGHLESTKVWVVGDLKTPSETQGFCDEISTSGLETVYLDPAAQEQWGKRYRGIYEKLPWNNETRRNIGYLHALDDGCERLIAVDDDNWPTTDDLIGGHQSTGETWSGPLTREDCGYHNICGHLEFEPSRPIFPRGYPFRLRGRDAHPERITPPAPVTVGVTGGLWLGDPDIDATTWLNGAVSATRFTGEGRFVLAQDTWSPINTQNTSVARALVPAFLCIPMGWDVPGGKIQRYGDIWCGYFLQAVTSGTEFHVGFGRPLVEHRRNPHDYVDDLRHEFWGMVLTDWLLGFMRSEFRPTGGSISDRVRELSGFLGKPVLSHVPGWCPPEVRRFIESTATSLSAWANTCDEIGV